MSTQKTYRLTDVINLNVDNSFYEVDNTLPELSVYLYTLVDEVVEMDEAWERLRDIADNFFNDTFNDADQEFLKHIGINVQPLSNN